MKNIIFILLFLCFISLFSAQSVIIEATGVASMGDTKSRKETINEAKTNALNAASQNASTYITSETTVRDYITEKDLVEAFSQAVVKVLEEVKGEWFKDNLTGESYKITLKVEVTPKEMTAKPNEVEMIDSPNAPLTVKLWTDKNQTEFKAGEKINLYLKGNKPFFARVVYAQNDGSLVQILPNPFRKDNYFNGGTVYTLPSGKDTYELSVEPPFGNEKILVYASTDELGDVKLEDAGAIFIVNDNLEDTGIKTRGIKIQKKEGKSSKAAEFFESELKIKTMK
ncbi:MAG: DUF4384 domain-containing protein [Candidatus Delongbacteria bacterium]|nr:DUF4384 domain-containing protein [Candidatus Delongbacteria bacterium]MCG2760848.1 DUF4384 domain-containing protein [Candidatus Delongbacteria bacterium]